MNLIQLRVDCVRNNESLDNIIASADVELLPRAHDEQVVCGHKGSQFCR